MESNKKLADESRKPTGILPTLYGNGEPRDAAAPKNTKRASSNSTSKPPSFYQPYIPSENEDEYDGESDDALESDLNTTEITGKYVWKA